jgi:hypothetical protein
MLMHEIAEKKTLKRCPLVIPRMWNSASEGIASPAAYLR